MTTAAAHDIATLVDRLAAHRTLGGAPRSELEWLATHGELQHYESGHLLAKPGELAEIMIVMLSGGGAVYLDRGSGRRKVMEWHAGDVTGVLPFSRISKALGEPMIEEPTDALVLHRSAFPELIHRCPVVTESLVHSLLDRVRHFTSTDWQDDKMVSLGRLAAGLSHELNNPASAASRSAQLLGDALTETDEAASALVAAHLTDAQRAQLDALRRGLSRAAGARTLSAIERADREDEMAIWLENHHINSGIAAALGETDVTLAALDELAGALPAGACDAALRWLAAGHTSRALATDVERATTRIYELVSAVKRFTHMDRPTVAEPTHIAQGIVDTVTMLTAKAREKGAAVEVDVPADLPPVPAYGGELNQVWSNLIENALDAIAPAGHVRVIARAERGHVVVRVADDGHGIPSDITGRIFDPFFTTKPVGQGTGLGLDTARRIVRRHEGQIDVESAPGRTEFRVTLPTRGASA